jgi:UDP-glucose 4-epimerase
MSSLPVVLVTGGAGYIGSHFLEQWSRAASEYLDPCQLVVLDNFSGGHYEIMDVIDHEFRKAYLQPPQVERVDLCNFSALKDVFEKYRPSMVVHFAGKISVAESVANPGLYHRNNVEGSENLLSLMREYGCKKMVFSSTAAVYGNVEGSEPIGESHPVGPLNPYGQSKLSIEQAMDEASKSWELQGIVFRYFNAAGASSSGLIGEWHEPETHLIPLVIESAMGGSAELKLFGTDYPTRDGTCVRDYIHVTDLAQAHILGLARLAKGQVSGVEIYNLGTENGTTVREVIEAVRKVTRKPVAAIECERRPGDAPFLIASQSRAKSVLGWKPIHSDIETILRTALSWYERLQQMKGIRQTLSGGQEQAPSETTDS